MRAGLVAAALNEGCTLNYVGTENQNGRKDDGLGIVKDGYESHMKQTDPYDFFAISEEDRGIKFFNKYHFYAAIENFNEALKKTGDENHKNKFKIYKKLSQIYNSWDKFVEDNNGSLYLHLENVQEEIRSYSNNSIMTFDFLDKLNENLIFLKSKLKEKTSNQIDYYVIDLINNAERRLKEGKYDDAIARLYRAIELIAQLNFANLGLMDEKKINDNKEFEYDLNAFERKYNSYKFEEITTKFGKFRKSGTVKNIYTPGLKGTYDLLKLLNQRLGLEFSKKYYNKEKNEELSIFESTLKARNKSILAHGLQPVDKETVKILLNDTIFFGKIIIRNFDKKKRMGEFIKLAYTFGSVF
jgi:CRISPR-associated protein (TIGR02710 family)